MRINSSSVAMQSNRSYYALEEMNSVSVSTNSGSSAAILTFSAESRELLEQSSQTRFNNDVVSYPNDRKEKIGNGNDRAVDPAGADSGANAGNGALFGVVQRTNQTPGVGASADSKSEMMLQVLKTLIAAMRRLQAMNAKKGKPVDMSQIERLQRQYERIRKNMGRSSMGVSMGSSLSVGMSQSVSGSALVGAGGAQSVLGARNVVSVGDSNNSTVWRKSTVESVFYKETEHTAYSAQGMVVTADGRHIGFNVDVEMSRAFEAQYQNYTEEEYIVTDPLVINLDSDVVDVTDQKFLFDIDSDGTKDEISFTGQGSGFLALDKNGDGTINDGSELFGTKSGDGFKDLAAYDTDRNGWIDEADDVFSKLKIWTKDEDGNDKLLSLKDAGVGAMYLASNDTKFHLNDDETNETNAIIRKTGIYLKESGEVGTMQHVDLVL